MFIPKQFFGKFMQAKKELKSKYGQAKEHHTSNGRHVILDVGTNKLRVFDKKDGTWGTMKAGPRDCRKTVL